MEDKKRLIARFQDMVKKILEQRMTSQQNSHTLTETEVYDKNRGYSMSTM
jgi:hypothetical protein